MDMDMSSMIAVVSAIVGILSLQVIISKWITNNRNVSVNELHLSRRIQHALTGTAMIASRMSRITYMQNVLTLAGCTIWFYCMHLLRLRIPWLQNLMVKNFKSIARPNEIAGDVPGSFYFLLAATISCAIFDIDTYIMSMLILSFGDPCAGIVGIMFSGKRPGGGKTWTGSGGAFLGSFLSNFIFRIVFEMPHGKTEWDHFASSVILGVIGAFAERIELREVNDNFMIPLVSGILIRLLKYMNIWHFQ